MIELDGSHGEGGGAILRQALALSMLTGKAFRIANIRKARPKPGLSPQHLTAVLASQEICNAEFSGNKIGSTEIEFKPGKFKGGHHDINIGTAGSITLLLQSLLLPSIFCGKKVSFYIKGGTDVKWSMPFDYFNSVFVPQMKRYANIEANLYKRGYYPKGGGEIRVVVNGQYDSPNQAPSILLLEQKSLLQIRGISHASVDLENARVAERQSESARLYLGKLKAPFSCTHQYYSALSIGSGLTLWAVFGEGEVDFSNPIILGADSLGERNKKAEIVGKEASSSLESMINSGAAVDKYLADQLIPFMALTGGIIRTSEITNHVKSNIYVAEKFLDVNFTIKNNIISCEKKNKEE